MRQLVFLLSQKSPNSRLRGNFFLLRKSASCRPEINPNVNPALKNFSARHFIPEDKFLEGLPLLLIAMFNEIKIDFFPPPTSACAYNFFALIIKNEGYFVALSICFLSNFFLELIVCGSINSSMTNPFCLSEEKISSKV